jgi:hypothetical protein
MGKLKLCCLYQRIHQNADTYWSYLQILSEVELYAKYKKQLSKPCADQSYPSVNHFWAESGRWSELSSRKLLQLREEKESQLRAQTQSWHLLYQNKLQIIWAAEVAASDGLFIFAIFPLCRTVWPVEMVCAVSLVAAVRVPSTKLHT